MKKAIKYISILALVLLFVNSVCFATNINMNLQDNISTKQNTVSNDTVTNSSEQGNLYQSSSNENLQPESSKDQSQITTVSGSSTNNQNVLTASNIINIFLVVVGIVLILLGLAILIRLKY